jgi:sigma-B regulation protein RsbU (phosphoserine phosphatase)
MSRDMQRPRVLVVDDDPGMLRAVSRVLQRTCEVLTSDRPLESLELAASFRPDAVLLDIRMPEMNGFDLMCRLREKQPGLDVILMTGDADEPEAALIRAIDEGAFYFIQKPFDRRVLLALVGRCLELRRLRDERQRYVQQLESELEEARRFQASLLPAPELTTGQLSIAARFVPCSQLAGDYFDYAAVGDEGIALIIADVAGHGASAAMLTGVLKSAFHAAHADNFEPMSIVDRVRAGIRAFDGGRFVTLCCARLDPVSRELSYVNAGHPPPIIFGPGIEPKLLAPTGPLLSSMLEDIPCEQATVVLGERERLLLYTDGVTEAVGRDGMFGRRRIIDAVSAHPRNGGALLDHLLDAVATFTDRRPTTDDMTLLAAELHA